MTVEPWVIVVGMEPAEPGSREMLELVLAGATLELALVVVFEGPGCGHLEPDVFAPWRQLIDFDLAELRARQPRSALIPSGVTAIEADEFKQLCRDAAGVLRL
ncbi:MULTISPECIES: hypothetical protein [unclassified Wenzhouxiangella]|uniref:hypothetical protein n=1 Tax=unclassified Wenzhouxiangella TaxID=2613841 RepID=UPI000E3299A1|nr:MULTISPECIES: hypothetical protein [unclassified Wenzhouxiangella]RFF27641.1 hypothetical protein DZK25_07185 [Wenzhouxiangella sp. 15181]RFP70164.1 hypothetical protein DZK26_01190 [Wenzhouxiangella sp. 15190]